MKITLNLAVAPSFRERYALAWSVPTALAGLVLMAVLAVSTVSAFRSYRRAEADLAGPAAENNRLAAREMELRRALDRPELRDKLAEAQSANALIEKKRLLLGALAAKVSGLLPPDARLKALALTRVDNNAVVRFEVNTRDPQAAETFLGNLTGSPDFVDATTTSEGMAESAQPGGEITLACTARYVGGETSGSEPGRNTPSGEKPKSRASPAGAKQRARTQGNAELTQNAHPGI